MQIYKFLFVIYDNVKHIRSCTICPIAVFFFGSRQTGVAIFYGCMLSIEDNFAAKKILYLFNIMVHKIILFIHFYSLVEYNNPRLILGRV